LKTERFGIVAKLQTEITAKKYPALRSELLSFLRESVTIRLTFLD